MSAVNGEDLLRKLQQNYPVLEAQKKALDTCFREFDALKGTDSSPSRQQERHELGAVRRGTHSSRPSSDSSVQFKILENKINRDFITLKQGHDAINQEFLRYKGLLSQRDRTTWSKRLGRMDSDVTLTSLYLEQALSQFKKPEDDRGANRTYLFQGYDAEASRNASSAASEKESIQTSQQMLISMLNQGRAALESLGSQNQTLLRVKAKDDDMSATVQLSRQLMGLIEHSLSSDRRLVILGCILTIVICSIVYYLVHG